MPPPLVPPGLTQEPSILGRDTTRPTWSQVAPPMSPTRPPLSCPTASQRGVWGTPARLRGVKAGGTPEQGAVGDDEDGECLQGMGRVYRE